MNKRRKKNRQLVYLLVALFLLFSLILVLFQYKSYEKQLEILYQVLASEDNIDVSTQILKGYKINMKNGKKILEAYGYRKNNDALYRAFVKDSTLIVAVSLGMFGIVTLILNYTSFQDKKIRIINANEIEERLRCILSKKEVFPPSNIYIEEEYERVYESLCYVGETIIQLTQEQEREKEATKALVTDISHQLKTPVAALKTSLEILEHEDLSRKDREEFMNRSIEQINGIESLLDALIQISRMEAGMIEIKKESQTIFDTVIESVNRIYIKAQEKKILLEMEAEEEIQQLSLPHDKKWLCEAFLNILDNAVKYSPNETKITIRMIQMVTFLRIEFEDEGIGVDRQEYNQVFKRFYRGVHKEVKSQSGSGVGLYLTREIISRHRGTVSVHTGRGKKGARFVVQLPIK